MKTFASSTFSTWRNRFHQIAACTDGTGNSYRHCGCKKWACNCMSTCVRRRLARNFGMYVTRSLPQALSSRIIVFDITLVLSVRPWSNNPTFNKMPPCTCVFKHDRRTVLNIPYNNYMPYSSWTRQVSHTYFCYTHALWGWWAHRATIRANLGKKRR